MKSSTVPVPLGHPLAEPEASFVSLREGVWGPTRDGWRPGLLPCLSHYLPPCEPEQVRLLSSPDGGRSEQVGARCALSNGRSATTASAPVRVRVPPGVVGDSRSLSASVPSIGLYPQSGAGGLAVVGDPHSRRVNRPGPATWPARSTGPLIRPRRFPPRQVPPLRRIMGVWAQVFPTGTVTFAFTDIEGSTQLLHDLGAQGYAAALA